MTLATIAVLVACYLLGSLNFAIAVLRIGGFPDPRTLHSGNPGASNVARVAGRPRAGLVLLLDMARAVSVQWAATRCCPSEWIPWAGVALILGNRFPLFHGFRGGKGVAAYLGFVGATQPGFALLACGAWLACYLPTKIPALASMAMLLVLAGAALRASPTTIAAVSGTLLTAALIVVGHWKNWVAWRERRQEELTTQSSQRRS
jgi:acyl phosphate:glycerol-3-phosphate acyltransferase